MITTKIYAVPLKYTGGFTYVEVFPNRIFGHQIRALNFVSEEVLPLSSIGMEHRKEFCPRLLMFGDPGVRKYKQKMVWKHYSIIAST